MATDWHDADKVCPYYRFRTTRGRPRIGCSGYAEGIDLTIEFATVRALERHEERFCESLRNYEQCPLCGMVTAVRDKE